MAFQVIRRKTFSLYVFYEFFLDVMDEAAIYDVIILDVKDIWLH